MRRYTTASPSLVVEGVDLTSISNVWITFRQIYPDDLDSTVQHNLEHLSYDSSTLTLTPTTKTKSGNDTLISCNLSQEQTARFKPGRIRVQVNWKTSGGIRKATDIAFIPAFDNLLEEVK